MKIILSKQRFLSYLKVWIRLAINSIQETFINRGTSALFFSGKAIRFGMMIVFLLLLQTQLDSFAGYTTSHLVVFYLTYYFVDLFGQIIFRGVYQFGQKIRTGEFDFFLLKPVSPLFQSLVGKPDINDLIFLVPSGLISFYLVSQLDIAVTTSSLLWFALLFINGLVIITSLHILVLAVAIITVDIDGIIWLFRDVSRLGQFPVSIYFEPLRTILFFLIPIGMMVTIPAEILIGSSSSHAISTAIFIGFASLITSLSLWKLSLRYYSSASS